MSDPSYAIQVAEAAALLADAAVTGLVGANVFDEASAPDATYPRIEIGDHQVIGDGDTAAPGKVMVHSTVEVFASGAGGRLIAKQIGEAVEAVLTQRLTLSAHVMVSVRFMGARYFVIDEPTDSDGVAGKGILEFQYRTFPTS